MRGSDEWVEAGYGDHAMSTKRTTSSRGKRPASDAAPGTAKQGNSRGLRAWAPTIIAGVGLAAILSVYAVVSAGGMDSGGPPAAAPGAFSVPAAETPEPWEYDEANNRHWHPGHGHWHAGPPPEEGEREESSPPEPEAP